MERRDFIFKTSSSLGAIVSPFWYDKALNFIAKHNEPLIELEKSSLLKRMRWNEDTGSLWYDIGVVEEDFDTLAKDEWGEDNHYISYKTYFDRLGIDYKNPVLMDLLMKNYSFKSIADPYQSIWDYQENDALNPYDNAADYLQLMDLGNSSIENRQIIGELKFVRIEGEAMGAGRWTEVRLKDPLSISCLQARLNELGAQIRIEP